METTIEQRQERAIAKAAPKLGAITNEEYGAKVLELATDKDGNPVGHPAPHEC